MKKVILKSTLAVVAVAASCLGAWKAYGAYGSVDNSMLMENIEALSDENPEVITVDKLLFTIRLAKEL